MSNNIFFGAPILIIHLYYVFYLSSTQTHFGLFAKRFCSPQKAHSTQLFPIIHGKGKRDNNNN